MADLLRHALGERDIEQAITALKKGAYLLKYGRRGRPKFCPFRLTPDESSLIWYYGKQEKKIDLRNVTRILPGQRTPIFQRYPRPEKDYQSFSLLYDDRSLDLICKDKDEAEVWFAGLKALISRSSNRKIKNEARSDYASSDSSSAHRPSVSVPSSDSSGIPRSENIVQSRLGKAFADIVSYTAAAKNHSFDTALQSVNSVSPVAEDDVSGRCSINEASRISLSSAVSSSSHSSLLEEFDILGDCYIWGEGFANAALVGGESRINYSSGPKLDTLLPRALESIKILNVRSIAGGSRHALLVTKHGEVYSWGEELGGRLGHGVAEDVSDPKLIHALTGKNIEMVECGKFHSSAITQSGDLYTWGDGTISCGLLGHGSKVSHWIPRKVGGVLEGLPVSYISCGPWHTALITSAGQLFTFGDGTFGALGHGDRDGVETPREVEALKGLRSLRVACGAWHTAAVVSVVTDFFEEGSIDVTLSGKLFTWGDGDKGRLGHGDKKSQSVPECIASLGNLEFTKVACGCDSTVALTDSGLVYTMGLGRPSTPICIEGPLADSYVIEIACGSDHVAVLTSESQVYTWGKGTHGQLGHGDYADRRIPTLVDSLKDKQVKSVTCGSNFTAIISLHKSVSGDENSVCSGCQNIFSFRRKKHNCYNCGLVFCHTCSIRKSMKASLAPNTSRPYRVCDDCFYKLQKAKDSGSSSQTSRTRSGSAITSRDSAETSSGPPHPKLSPSDSFKYESRISKSIARTDLNDVLFPPREDPIATKESFPLRISPAHSISNFLSLLPPISISRSMPGRRSLAQSPITMSSVPVNASDVLPQDEIKNLKAQVEELVSKNHHLEAELEKMSIQLNEATILAETEAEEKKVAQEVIKHLSEQLEKMAIKVSGEQKKKNCSNRDSEHLNDPNDLPSGNVVDNKEQELTDSKCDANLDGEEKLNDLHRKLGDYITYDNSGLNGDQERKDLEQKLGKHIANDNSDLSAEEKRNRLKKTSIKYRADDDSDLNVGQSWDSFKQNLAKHIANENSDLSAEQKRNRLKKMCSKYRAEDDLDLNVGQSLNSLKLKLGKHIANENSDLNAEEKRNRLKKMSSKYRAEDDLDLNVGQSWNSLKLKLGKHIANDNSDLNAEEKRNRLKKMSSKYRAEDDLDLNVGQSLNSLKLKLGKHIANENSDLNAEQKRNRLKKMSSKYRAEDDLDLNVGQSWNSFKLKLGKHIANDNSDLNAEEKRNRLKKMSSKYRAEDDLDLNVGQSWDSFEHKLVKHVADDDSNLNVEQERNGLEKKPGKHIADDNPDLSGEQKRNRLKRSSMNIADDNSYLDNNSDLSGEQKRNRLRRSSMNIGDDNSDLDNNSDLSGEQKRNRLKKMSSKYRADDNLDINLGQSWDIFEQKHVKHIADDDSNLNVEQEGNGLEKKPGKPIADDKPDLNVEQEGNGLENEPGKPIADDNPDLNVEQEGNGLENEPGKPIADDNPDLNVEQEGNGLENEPGKPIADDNPDLNVEQEGNGLENEPGKHIADDNQDLNGQQKLNLNYQPDEEGSVTSEDTSKSDHSDSPIAPALSNSKNCKTHKEERMIQEQPGVYIILCALPSGGNELKRVRFSRKRFTEQQADKWWKENLSRVTKRHDIRIL